MKKIIRAVPLFAVLLGLLLAVCGCVTDRNTVELDKTSLSLMKGDVVTLTATWKAAEEDAPAWTSSDETVVAVIPGESGEQAVVRAVGTGSATVTVTVGELTAECTVTVAASPLSIFLPEAGLVLKTNMTASVKAICTEQISGEVVWESSDEAIGTVEWQGLTAIVKGVARGTCFITVRAGGYVASFPLTVGTSGH